MSSFLALNYFCVSVAMLLIGMIGLVVGYIIPRPGETVDECRKAYEAGKMVGKTDHSPPCPSELSLAYRSGYNAALDSREGD